MLTFLQSSKGVKAARKLHFWVLFPDLFEQRNLVSCADVTDIQQAPGKPIPQHWKQPWPATLHFVEELTAAHKERGASSKA